jgi:hypothetical protein
LSKKVDKSDEKDTKKTIKNVLFFQNYREIGKIGVKIQRVFHLIYCIIKRYKYLSKLSKIVNNSKYEKLARILLNS